MYVYEAKNGFYKKTYKFHIAIISFVFTTLLFFTLFLGSTIKSNNYRRQLDTAREQLTRAEDTNRELTDKIGQCRFIVKDLAESTDRNIEDVRGIIDLVEEVRVQVYNLEMVIDNSSSDDVYSRIDNWLQSEGIEYDR